MPWPIPQPGDIADRAASIYEGELARIWALRNPGGPPATVDARSPNSTLAVHTRVLDMAAFDLWSFLPRAVQELMPDTASDWLSRHAAIWGVPQIQATAATGNAVFAGIVSTAIPSGLALSAPGGAAYVTTAAAVIGGGGTVSVPVAAAVAGVAGSLPASTVLAVVNPLAGLTNQTATVDTGGLTGEDAESTDAWRARILLRIRTPGAAGTGRDYERWAREALPGAIVAAMSPGAGLVTVAFAMPSGTTWRAPTGSEIATVSGYLNDAQQRKPLGAPFINVVAATIQPIAFSIHLNVDTTATRTAATNALGLQLLADATIGGTIYMSRCDAALENASGEFSHERSVPSADVTAGDTTLSILGTVSFT